MTRTVCIRRYRCGDDADPARPEERPDYHWEPTAAAPGRAYSVYGVTGVPDDVSDYQVLEVAKKVRFEMGLLEWGTIGYEIPWSLMTPGAVLKFDAIFALRDSVRDAKAAAKRAAERDGKTV